MKTLKIQVLCTLGCYSSLILEQWSFVGSMPMKALKKSSNLYKVGFVQNSLLTETQCCNNAEVFWELSIFTLHVAEAQENIRFLAIWNVSLWFLFQAALLGSLTSHYRLAWSWGNASLIFQCNTWPEHLLVIPFTVISKTFFFLLQNFLQWSSGNFETGFSNFHF